MVVFKGARGERVCAQPPDDIRALLIYGANSGLVGERAQAAVKFAVEDLSDAFRLGEIQARDVAQDPARLADELAALSLGGGRRAVWLKGAGDSLGEAISAALERDFGDTLLVIEAANLGPRSSLRKMFEKESGLAAVPCYEDDHASLRNYVSGFLSRENANIDQEALEWLLLRLGNDRMQVRNELEKLILYASGDGAAANANSIQITLDTVMAGVGDAGVLSLDHLADAVAGGELANIDRFLTLAFEQYIQPVAVIRFVGKRFSQLHFVVGLGAGGESTERLIISLRPPVFYKNRPAFQAQAARWSLPRIAQALDILIKAEIDCKTTGMPSAGICARALIRIGGAARAGGGRD